MKLIYCLLLAGLSAGPARAQRAASFGLRLGGNLATGRYTNQDYARGSATTYDHASGFIGGFQGGVAASFGAGHWAVQPALLYMQKGLTQRFEATGPSFGGTYREQFSSTTRIDYLELPLNVVYGFGREGQGVQVFAGPYVAVGLGGRSRYAFTAEYFRANGTPDAHTDDNQSRLFLPFGDTYEAGLSQAAPVTRARRLDAGLTVGLGYRRGPVQAQLGYGLGLLNAQPDYPAGFARDNATGYLRTLQLAATYYFSR